VRGRWGRWRKNGGEKVGVEAELDTAYNKNEKSDRGEKMRLNGGNLGAGSEGE
jgi:hypothetical protein